jgi:hypothetical protein
MLWLGRGGGPKGAVGVRLLVAQSSFCFLNCHLAAGQDHIAERNANMAAIVREAEFPVVPTQRGPRPPPAPALSRLAPPLQPSPIKTCCIANC